MNEILSNPTYILFMRFLKNQNLYKNYVDIFCGKKINERKTTLLKLIATENYERFLQDSGAFCVWDRNLGGVPVWGLAHLKWELFLTERKMVLNPHSTIRQITSDIDWLAGLGIITKKEKVEFESFLDNLRKINGE